MSIYKHLSYRDALNEIIQNRRHLPGKFTLRKLAEACALQASYLTNVLKGRFDFSNDQLFALASELGLKVLEREYLLLLLDYERATHKPRREDLKRKIDSARRENLQSEKHLDIKAVEHSSAAQIHYFLDPFAQLALVYLNVEPYKNSPEQLGSVLGVSQSHLGEIFKTLLANGYVEQEGARYKVKSHNKHLPKRNPLSGPHLTLMRLKALDQLQRLAADQAFSHTVTFTGTTETKQQLSEAYLEFLKTAETIVKPAVSERVFQMSFDLFPWDLKER